MDFQEDAMEKITVKKGETLEDVLCLEPAPFGDDEPYLGEEVEIEYE